VVLAAQGPDPRMHRGSGPLVTLRRRPATAVQAKDPSAESIRKLVVAPRRCLTFQRAAPGEVMDPWKEPEVRPVFRFVKRSTMKLPWAPANRPVPPVMVWISTI
jgi:hypothetical protein